MIPTARPSPQPKRHPYRFSRLCTDDCSVAILYKGTPILPQKFAPSHGGCGSPSNTWLPGPTQVLNPNGSSIGAAVFAGLTSVTDRPTDHATRSVRIGRIYVRSTAMRPNNTCSLLFCPVWAAWHNAPLIHLLILALICIVCLFTWLLLTSLFLYHTYFSLLNLLPYLPFPLRISPLHFQAGSCKR